MFKREDEPEDIKVWANSLANKLLSAGVKSVQWYVNGSGDSPDNPTVLSYNDGKAARSNAEHNGWYGGGQELLVDTPKELIDEIDMFFWEWADGALGQGWYNNGGGYICASLTTEPTIQVWGQLWEYPEPEADITNEASLFEVVAEEENGESSAPEPA